MRKAKDSLERNVECPEGSCVDFFFRENLSARGMINLTAWS
jgi:hypothetical protein